MAHRRSSDISARTLEAALGPAALSRFSHVELRGHLGVHHLPMVVLDAPFDVRARALLLLCARAVLACRRQPPPLRRVYLAWLPEAHGSARLERLRDWVTALLRDDQAPLSR